MISLPTGVFPRLSLEQRFLAKTSRADVGCWYWLAAKSNKGYGVIGDGKSKVRLAHRVSYELFVAEIPEGLELDHLCSESLCVNPNHLELVTHAENVQRGLGNTKFFCKYGHRLEDRGGRQKICVECRRRISREWARKKRAAGKV